MIQKSFWDPNNNDKVSFEDLLKDDFKERVEELSDWFNALMMETTLTALKIL